MNYLYVSSINRVSSIQLTLMASGLTAIVIGLMILISPAEFYSGSDIELADNITLVNELKAPAGFLLVSGLIMLAGVLKAQWSVVSLTTATTVYLTYGLSRVTSMVIDGMPSSAMIAAALIEMVIGTICLISLLRIRKT